MTGLPTPAAYVRPGGRWHRILTALAHAVGPLIVGDLLQLTGEPEDLRPRRRRKMRAALKELAAQGLVERGPHKGWSITIKGDDARRRADTAQAETGGMSA